jgi:hypothetical protein
MSSDSSHGKDSFVGLNTFNHINTSIGTAKSSLLKSSAVKHVGIAKIDVLEGKDAEPTVFVHRQGDAIVKIEFICSCGRSTHLDIEHADE